MGCSNNSVETKPDEKPIKNSSFQASEQNQKRIETKASTIQIASNNMIGEDKDSYKKKYKALQKIGSGAYGKVYKVQHLATNQIRAMKLIKKESLSFQDDDQKFLKEIEILSKLDHPNIIKIFEYFQDLTHYYIVTELCEGGELFEQIVKNQYLTECTTAMIMKQLFSTVFYMHSKGVVHRDLKPENILIESKGNSEIFIKIIDFGTSNYFDNTTKFTYKIGTPYYIAPEVIKMDYTNKCDLWSCGVILFILLSGYAPFDGKNDEEIMKNVQKGQFRFDEDIWDAISPSAKNLISKLLRLDPEKRISAEEAWSDEWIQIFHKKSENLNELPLNKIKLSNLKNFAARQKFQQATLAFLVHQVSTSDMMKDLRTIFKEFDKNGDGQLTYSELREGFKKYFKNDDIGDKEFDLMIKNFDLDNNNIIEYEEFLRVTVNPDTLITDKNLKMAFDFFDKDKSGKLSPDEIKLVLGIGSQDKDNEIINQIIREVDLNNDGVISFDEFKHLMVKVVQNKK